MYAEIQGVSEKKGIIRGCIERVEMSLKPGFHMIVTVIVSIRDRRYVADSSQWVADDYDHMENSCYFHSIPYWCSLLLFAKTPHLLTNVVASSESYCEIICTLEFTSFLKGFFIRDQDPK